MKSFKELFEIIEFEPESFEEIEKSDSKKFYEDEKKNAFARAKELYGDSAFFYTVSPRGGDAYDKITLLVRFKRGGAVYYEVFKSESPDPIFSQLARLGTTKKFKDSLETYLKMKHDPRITKVITQKMPDDENEPLPLDIVLPR